MGRHAGLPLQALFASDLLPLTPNRAIGAPQPGPRLEDGQGDGKEKAPLAGILPIQHFNDPIYDNVPGHSLWPLRPGCVSGATVRTRNSTRLPFPSPCVERVPERAANPSLTPDRATLWERAANTPPSSPLVASPAPLPVLNLDPGSIACPGLDPGARVTEKKDPILH
jgi:hypothetical protein